MTQIAFIDLAAMLDSAGFSGGVPQADGIAIICAESDRDPAAKNINTDGSIDRGLWQINDRAHPEVTDAQAFDPTLATAAAFRISQGGTNYTPWSTWGNGSYTRHLEAARVALDGWSRVKKLTGQLNIAAAGLAAAQAQIVSLQNQLSTSQAITSAAKSELSRLANSLTSLSTEAAFAAQ